MLKIIGNLLLFLTENEWLQRLRSETFGLVLPDGWFGKPYDNFHKLSEISVSGNVLKIVFDDVQELKIVSPKRYELENIGSKWSSLSFFDCQEISFKWVPYGEGNPGRSRVRTFVEKNNSLKLVGYFSVDPCSSPRFDRPI